MVKQPQKPNRKPPTAKQLANLKPFKPGQSGNPGGRPKKVYTEAHHLIAKLKVKDLRISPEDTVPVAAAKAAAQQMLKGKIPALVEVSERTEGKVITPTETAIFTDPDRPAVISVKLVRPSKNDR